MDVEDTKVKFGGIAVSIIIALVWGFDTCKDIYSMLLNRDKVDQEETPEAAPTGNTSVAKTKKPRETT
jgi:hypothetical protein